MGKGTIVDASIISAPPSTKNKDRARDPEMHQTRKGKQWYFGMKAHIGMDRHTKVIHTVAATAANVHDATCLGQLLHGEETEVWGDSAYSVSGPSRVETPRRGLTRPVLEFDPRRTGARPRGR